MNRVHLDRQQASSLLDQIVEELRRRIDERIVPPGSKLPSIRTFATEHGISRFTVVEAYDKLVAMGYLETRRGTGFFVASPTNALPASRPTAAPRLNDTSRLVERLLSADDRTILASGPWLPSGWFDTDMLKRIMRGVAAADGTHLTHYGEPLGYRPLRSHIVQALLPDIGIGAHEDQLVLTCGASQALDLVARTLCRPGDAVLVDDPGYYNLYESLRAQGLRLIGIERQADGPDIAALEARAAEHRPVLYFTQSVLQNPTGTTMSHHKAFQTLQLATRYGFRVVEDDIFCDLHPEAAPRLAALDQLQHVIYLRSFSKTLSGSVRVGFVACDPALADQLSRMKMATCVSTSLFGEKVVYRLLTEGYYRKFLARLLDRINDAHIATAAAFERIGIEALYFPRRGMFVWGRFDGIPDSATLSRIGEDLGVVVAPGAEFRPDGNPTAWTRFNITICADPEAQRRLEQIRNARRDWPVRQAELTPSARLTR